MSAQTEEAAAIAGVFALEPGLFAISIGPLPASPGAGGLAFPVIQVSRFPQPGLGEVAILGADGPGEPWLGSDGGVVAVRSPPDGGAVVISLLGPAGTNPALPAVKIRRLDADSEEILPQAAKPAELAGESPQVEILLHIQRLGDRRFSGGGWAGTRGMELGIEGFAINPQDGILPRDLEYQGFLPGEETPWLSGGELCGSRGQRRPLTGFALRLAPAVAERFDIVYSGAFGNSGTVGPRRNGEPCGPNRRTTRWRRWPFALSGAARPALHRRVVSAGQSRPGPTATQDAGSGAGRQVRVMSGRSRIVTLEEGLYSLSVSAVTGEDDLLTKIAPAPVQGAAAVELAFGSDVTPGWISAGGGVVIVRPPTGGGVVIVTTYGAAEGALPDLTIDRLDKASGAAEATPSAPAPLAGTCELPVEIMLHIERQGDRRAVAQGWVGNLGQRLRIEAFGLRPLETIGPGDIEYMSFGPQGRYTPWVSDGRLCGSRGRGIPLTGLAIRLKPELQQRFDVLYEGSFFESGTSELCRNGEPCRSSITDDPLEAINLRVIERAS